MKIICIDNIGVKSLTLYGIYNIKKTGRYNSIIVLNDANHYCKYNSDRFMLLREYNIKKLKV